MFRPVGENKDVLSWLDWFMKKVGPTEANKLLFDPLLSTCKAVQHSTAVKDTKAYLVQEGMIPPDQ